MRIAAPRSELPQQKLCVTHMENPAAGLFFAPVTLSPFLTCSNSSITDLAFYFLFSLF